MAKSNIELLKETFKESYEKSEKIIKKLESDLNDEKEKVKELMDLDDEEEENFSADESVFLGLDTFEYRLENGNLLIQQRVDDFVEKLKKEFCIGTTA